MKKKPHRDPIADYQEWADNRYNPGHWLGANVPPNIKNLWSTTDRRWLGLVYVIPCGVALWFAYSKMADWDSMIIAAIMLAPILVPGLIMLLSRDARQRRQNKPK